MVMAMDFDCPFCRKAWDTVEQLRTRYPKDLRVVYKAFVVHPRTAMLPAQAACAASKQGKFRELAQLIWTKAYDARGTEKEPFGADHLRALAGEAKLDLARYDQDIAGACVNEVRDDMASMTKLGVNATPTFYINGRYKSGAIPIEQFAALIDEEMAKANAAIQRGVKPEQYYQQEVVAKGQAALAQP
jgi:protein-disulfide isomerase